MLILVRHGQTQANADGELLGRRDPPLTALGSVQADAVAAALGDGAVTRVVSSPLSRARDTAARLGLPVEVDQRWVELDYGELEGNRVQDVPDEVWRKWRGDRAWAPAGGESLASVSARVADACADLADAARAGNVVVVSHVSPIKAAVAWALGATEEVSWRMFLSVASISRVAVTPRGPSLHSFNEVHHLGSVVA